MIWLTWRQHRKQAYFLAAGFVALAVLLIPTGVMMHHALTSDGVAACLHKMGSARLVSDNQLKPNCIQLANAFTTRYGAFSTVAILFVFLPLLVGLFWGAPLVAREVEHGTHRFVWTQGVSRSRWAFVKFSIVGGVAVIAAALYAEGVSWWLEPLNRAANHGLLGDATFDVQGIVPIGYTLFAVALGVLAGTIWRRVLPAMAATLVAFIAVRVIVDTMVRPYLIPPKTLTWSVMGFSQTRNRMNGDWITSFGIRDAAGKMIQPNIELACSVPHGNAFCSTLTAADINWEQYQPAGRYWVFQGIEAGIFLALAGLLIYLAVRRVRRLT